MTFLLLAILVGCIAVCCLIFHDNEGGIILAGLFLLFISFILSSDAFSNNSILSALVNSGVTDTACLEIPKMREISVLRGNIVIKSFSFIVISISILPICVLSMDSLRFVNLFSLNLLT